MAGELSTEVHDDPNGSRTVAAYLRKVAESADHANQSFVRVQSESESVWAGTAGKAFRTAQTSNVEDSNQVAGVAGTFARALDAFAADIDTVRARLDQARGVAGSAGLITTPTVILPPGPADPAPGGASAGGSYAQKPDPQSPAAQHHRQQLLDHQQKQQAFDEVTATVTEARALQAKAHHELEAATVDPLATLKATKSWTMFVVGNGLSYVKASETTASDLMKKADAFDKRANEYEAMASKEEDPLLRRQYEASHERFQRESTRAQNAAENVRRPIRGIPRGARHAIEANPGNFIEGGETGWLRLGKGVARGAPVVGTALTVASGAGDWLMGKPAGQAAGETGGSLAGGVAGGMAGAEAGAVIGGSLGTLVPVAGNVTGAAVGGVVGGVAGGMIGSLSGTQAADDLMGVKP